MIIDGKKIAEEISAAVREKIKDLSRKPVLAMFLVGNDASSEIYIRKKEEACKAAGVESRKIVLPQQTTHQELLMEIDKLNQDEGVDAILVQLPLPDQIQEDQILASIDPAKDVDCLNPFNFGIFCEQGSIAGRIVPVTALAVLEMLKFVNVKIENSHAVIVGNSNIVGKPIALMLAEAGATITICHAKTSDIKKHTQQADILISGVGKKHLITGEMVKEGATVIDVGIIRENGKIYGDVDFEAVSKIASAITPVPGGVGPVTVAVLLKNTLEIYLKKLN